MENRYYEVEINDLNIGQEVFIMDTSNYNAKHTCSKYPCIGVVTELTDYPTIWVKAEDKTFELYPQQISLKYLDKEDIESLGWVKADDSIPKISSYKEVYKKENYFLIHLKDNFYKIVVFDIAKESDRLGFYEMYIPERFFGILKNSNELKVLMKMLEIND